MVASAMLEALSSIASEGAGARIKWAFEAMEIAEELLKGSQAPQGVFAILCPPSAFPTGGKQLYRAHARELIERTRKGEDTRPATAAEALFLMSNSSLKAPLAHWAHDFMVWLWRKAGMSETVFADYEPRQPTSSEDGSFEEELESIRRRLRDETRVLPGTAKLPRKSGAREKSSRRG